MSIIHDALKKVQSNRSQNNDTPAPAAKSAGKPLASVSPSVKTQASPLRRPVVFSDALWSLLILAMGTLTFLNLYELSNRVQELSLVSTRPPLALARLASTPVTDITPLAAPSVAMNTLATNPPTPPPATSVKDPGRPKPKPGEIILYGITFMDGKNFALLNDGIYEVGEEVEGSRIKAITPESVTLEKWGIPKTLKVTHR